MNNITKIFLSLCLFLTGIASASAECFLDSTTSGWTGSITFWCNAPTNLNLHPVSFDITSTDSSKRTIVIRDVWGLGSASYAQKGSHVTFHVIKWWSNNGNYDYILPANQHTKIYFSPSASHYAIHDFHAGPKNQISHATITLRFPDNPCPREEPCANISIHSDDRTVSTIDQCTWNTHVSVPISFTGTEASYTVIVQPLNHHKGMATPSHFVLSNHKSQDVAISYQTQSKKKGAIAIFVNIHPFINTITPETQPTYTLIAPDGTIKKGYLTPGMNRVSDLPASAEGVINYNLKTASYITHNIRFSPNTTARIIPVRPNVITSTTINYQGQEIPTEVLNINVSGLPSEAHTQIVLSPTTGVIKTLNVTGNKIYSISIPQNDQMWTITAASYNRYFSSVTPSHFIANKASENLTVSYALLSENMKLMPFKDMSFNMDWSVVPYRSNLEEIADHSQHYSYILAFITQNIWQSGCAPAWAGAQTLMLADGYYLEEINYLKARGGHIAISFGGENGTSVAAQCSASELTHVYQQTRNIYNPDFLDFDIEGGALMDHTANNRRFNVLKTMQQQNPTLKISLTLPANIYGFPASALNLIREAKNKGVVIDQYNMMTMAWYSQKLEGPIVDSVKEASEQGLAQLKTIFPEQSFIDLKAKIRVTPKIGIDYDQSVFYPKDATTLGQFVTENGLHGISFWSADIDRNQNKTGNCNIGANPDCSGIDQAPYDFTRAFLTGLLGH